MLQLINNYQTMELFKKGLTDGIPHFGNQNSKDLLQKIQPNSLEDLCVILSLDRENCEEISANYIFNKRSPKSIEYLHPLLKKYLKPTYGILIYNEQLMAILTSVACISIQESNLIRKALGKRHADNIKLYFQKFEVGCLNNPKFILGCTQIDKPPRTVILEIWNFLFTEVINTISFAYIVKHASESYLFAHEKTF